MADLQSAMSRAESPATSASLSVAAPPETAILDERNIQLGSSALRAFERGYYV